MNAQKIHEQKQLDIEENLMKRNDFKENVYTQEDLDKSLHNFKKEIVGLLKSYNVDKKIIHEINCL